MSLAQWTHTYGIDHSTIYRSSYRKLTWVWLEPAIIEFRSDALTDRAIRPWVQPALRANLVQQLQFHILFTVRFHFGYCLRRSLRSFCLTFRRVYHMSAAELTHIYGIHHLLMFGSSCRKLTLVGFEPATTEFHLQHLLCTATHLLIHPLFSVRFYFGSCLF